MKDIAGPLKKLVKTGSSHIKLQGKPRQLEIDLLNTVLEDVLGQSDNFALYQFINSAPSREPLAGTDVLEGYFTDGTTGPYFVINDCSGFTDAGPIRTESSPILFKFGRRVSMHQVVVAGPEHQGIQHFGDGKFIYNGDYLLHEPTHFPFIYNSLIAATLLAQEGAPHAIAKEKEALDARVHLLSTEIAALKDLAKSRP